jgi:hypothetical protein
MRPLSKEVALIKSISDLEISLGISVISTLALIYVIYFNSSEYFIFVVLAMLVITTILGLHSFIKLKKALATPLAMLKKIEAKDKLQ